MEKNSISRRSFLKSSALAGAAGMVGTGTSAGLLTSCQQADSGPKYTPLKEPGTYYSPELPNKAPDGRPLKAGLIGCGGRGTGAANDFLSAANGVTITALGDVFKDQVDRAALALEKRNINIPENMRFSGLDAYKQVIDSGVDIVLVATPPYFRPMQFKYAVEKGVHCFLEKPLFVDPTGYRSALLSARQAKEKNLCVFVGTQRNHTRKYIAAYRQVMDGMIGEITGGVVFWNGTVPWTRLPQPGMSDGEGLLRNWVNMIWLSGDHIVEQHVHNLDVFRWFTGLRPISAEGVGSRQRRPSGDMFDNFSIDFTMENGMHVHSMCRQIAGTNQHQNEFIQGTKGSLTIAEGGKSPAEIRDLSGNLIWSYDLAAESEKYEQNAPMVLEHIAMIDHIRAGKQKEQASELAISNMMAVMGREAAYTGRLIKWDEIIASDMDLTPPDFSLTGKMDMSQFKVPVAGSEPGQRQGGQRPQGA